MQRSKRTFCGLVAAAVALALAGSPDRALAQTYPAHSVKLITQGAAGSGPDVVARIATDALAKLWGQQIVVINQPGAGGMPAARAAVTADPDGYTLYMPAVSSFIVMPEMFPGLPFDLNRDFIAIGLFVEQPMAFAVDPKLGISSIKELIDYSKANPGKILYAANARGTFPHLTVERFRSETGADLTFVPYAGVAAGMQDILGGRISMIVESVSALNGGIQAGQIKAIGVASAKRLETFPDLPAVAETVPGFSATGWFALMAPKGTPDAIVQQLNRDLNTVLKMPEVKQRFLDIGSYVKPVSMAETVEYIHAEQTVWRPIVRAVGLGPSPK